MNEWTKQIHVYREPTRVTSEGKEGGREDRERGLGGNTGCVANEQAPRRNVYSTGRHSHYFIIALNGVQSIKILNRYVVHLKLTVLPINYSAIERKKQGKEGRGSGREGRKQASLFLQNIYKGPGLREEELSKMINLVNYLMSSKCIPFLSN